MLGMYETACKFIGSSEIRPVGFVIIIIAGAVKNEFARYDDRLIGIGFQRTHHPMFVCR